LTQILTECFYQTHEKTSFYQLTKKTKKQFKTHRRYVFFQFFTEAPRSEKTSFYQHNVQPKELNCEDGATSIKEVVDDKGRTPVYYALTSIDPVCLLLDKIAPKEVLSRESFCNLDDAHLKFQFETTSQRLQRSYQQNLEDRGFKNHLNSKTFSADKAAGMCTRQVKAVVQVVYDEDNGIVKTAMKEASKGKSRSQGGYNMDVMKIFIETNKDLFHPQNGPIFDSFPELHTLGRKDLNVVVELILEQDPDSVEQNFAASMTTSGPATPIPTTSVPATPLPTTSGPATPIPEPKTIHEAARHDRPELVIKFLTADSNHLNLRDKE